MNQLTFRLANHPLANLVFKSPWIGIFSSYADAFSAIPPSFQTGFDHKPLGEVFVSYPLGLVRPADYPILLHLGRLLHPGSKVIDLGGNIGMACYLAHRYLRLPSPLEWVICDVPAMIDAARQVAEREGSINDILRFATALEDAGRCDIFFTAGTLHHLELPLPDLLKKLPELPAAVLVNRIPVWDRPAMTSIALHFGTHCASPSHIFNRLEFTAAMEKLGYRLADDWDCPESRMSIRFHPSLRVNGYHGFYFSRNKTDEKTV